MAEQKDGSLIKKKTNKPGKVGSGLRGELCSPMVRHVQTSKAGPEGKESAGAVGMGNHGQCVAALCLVGILENGESSPNGCVALAKHVCPDLGGCELCDGSEPGILMALLRRPAAQGHPSLRHTALQAVHVLLQVHQRHADVWAA